jgi:hypothetical protein
MKKVVGAAKTRRTAGALPRLKAAKGKQSMRSPQVQPENYGYEIELVLRKGEVYVESGCRSLTLSAARKHWTARIRAECGSCGVPLCGFPDCQPNVRRRARKMVKLLPLLAQRARRYGWTKPTKTES